MATALAAGLGVLAVTVIGCGDGGGATAPTSSTGSPTTSPTTVTAADAATSTTTTPTTSAVDPLAGLDAELDDLDAVISGAQGDLTEADGSVTDE
jgi:hypothetical protein